MKYLITGGSGFIGSRVILRLLEQGHQVINLTRSDRKSSKKGLTHAKWDGKHIPVELGPVDCVINLAGASIGGQKWTASYKKVVLNSRINSTRACVNFIQAQEEKPMSFISASGYNYYGSHFKGVKTETDGNEAAGPNEFLPEVCEQWEKASEGAGVRTINLRTTVVLGTDDGPLSQMLTPFKFFVGGPLGDGKQGFPWIHIEDMAQGILFLATCEEIEGPVNMGADEQVTNEKFAKTLGNVLGRPSIFRLPKWLLQTIFGEMSVVLWGGGQVSNEKLKSAGFEFQFNELEPALEDLLGK